MSNRPSESEVNDASISKIGDSDTPSTGGHPSSSNEEGTYEIITRLETNSHDDLQASKDQPAFLEQSLSPLDALKSASTPLTASSAVSSNQQWIQNSLPAVAKVDDAATDSTEPSEPTTLNVHQPHVQLEKEWDDIEALELKLTKARAELELANKDACDAKANWERVKQEEEDFIVQTLEMKAFKAKRDGLRQAAIDASLELAKTRTL